jgi:hypothetical protein
MIFMLQVVPLDCNIIGKVWVIICYFLYFVVVFSFKTKKHKLDFLLEHLKEGRSKSFIYTNSICKNEGSHLFIIISFNQDWIFKLS